MKKWVFLISLIMTIGGISILGQQHAAAASGWQINYWNNYCSVGKFSGGCHGYFSNQVDWCMYASGNPNPGCNTGQVLTNGINVNSGPAFISVVQGALFGGNTQDRCGAAFIVDMMLGQGPYSSSCGAQVGPAQGRFNQWMTLVNSYVNSANPAYGVQWNVLDDPVVNSTYFYDTGDEVFHANVYHCTPSNGWCGGKYADEVWTSWRWTQVDMPIPVIQFYFPGGAFEIERGCANLVGNLNALPTINQPPQGNIISIVCTASQQVVTVRFMDPDAITHARIRVQGSAWTYTTGNSSGPGAFTVATSPPIPQSAAPPYSPVLVYLDVVDTGPGGSNAYVNVDQKPTTTPCATFSCAGMTTNPPRIDPYTRFSMSVSVANSVNQTPPGATMSLKITPPAGDTYSFNGVQIVSGGSPTTAVFNNLGPTKVGVTTGTGVYNVMWTLTAPGVNQSCPGTFQVEDLPYLSVNGGDVEAGIGPIYNGGSSTNCAENPSSSIFSWSNRAPSYTGGGAQYAVQALAQIEDFASALSAADNTAPIGLSLANFWNPPDGSKLYTANGLFGGYYTPDAATIGGDPYCDFTNGLTVTNAGNLTVAPMTQIGVGTQPIYVKGGDVYIQKDVIYANSGSWALPSSIPSFRLVVVGGDIYIDSGVKQLDGLYVAEPDSGTGKGGTIYTCATGPSTRADITQSGYYTTCNNPLVVNGAFVAKQVWLMRTGGTLGQPGSHGAEVFNYTPELWLPRGTAAPNNAYSSITGLPPIF